MGIRYKKDLKNIENYQKKLKDIDPIIRVEAINLMSMLLNAFSKRSNLSNIPVNRQLSDEYKDQKENSGRKGVRDLNYSGKLTNSFGIKKEGDAYYSIGPRGIDEQGKMEGNIVHDPNLMKVNSQIKKKIVQSVLNMIKKRQ